ncbi:23S rRNA m(2)A-2503 methyltransferase [Saccharicrinis carchari]|uniref:Probable dual-specificity RNA methyltransferase RlmN n=1 Tax=Saccharicrinis carchari TaxID=1168039 RepID=A0A521D360_SACCC|nr:23S rRNA (adenine(2503)-C(2))-methyltransferase RlmN [Saccharicrinis carchari]SMO66082.1 23S rRNA m(2)A-2503 methyltransferase [Saccharicrinis carchari]
MGKEALFGKTLSELQGICKELGFPGFTAKQMADWLYKKKINGIDDMLNISKKNRDILNEKYKVGLIAYDKVQESVDGTKKYLFRSGNNQFVEAAYIPSENRKTLCVSSQVGCKMACLFCMTGKQGFQKNLTAGEIVNQMVSIDEKDELTNVVYMGMGEPMDNIEQVLKSLEIITSDWGFAWSPRRINVSTIGVAPALRRFIEESDCHLAISMHSPYNNQRKELMPIENVYPIELIIDILKEYDFGRQRRISFEYIMFEGVNDTAEHAKALVRLVSGLRSRVNLIKFHPIPDTPLKGSSQQTMEAFKDVLEKKGVIATIRKSRGEDIYAACGLLSTRNMVQKNEEKDY